MKLNIGAGQTTLPGYEPWDIANGRQAYPLNVPDGSVEAIYASHILEHFPHGQTVAVLKDWTRALAPGGLLQVAVPDFEVIARRFLNCEQGNWEGYVMGGQTDPNDVHYAIFTRAKLAAAMTAAGLVELEDWTPTIPDCASLSISMNLQGRKPAVIGDTQAPAAPAKPANITVADPKPPAKPGLAKVVAVWSTGRTGFMDTWACIYKTLPPYGIPLVRGSGVFWGQAMEGTMTTAIRDHGATWLLGMDYDSVFEPEDLAALFDIINRHPQEIDALVPFQWSRCRNSPLWTPPMNADGTLPNVTDTQLRAVDHFPIGTGHFGLTLIRAAVVERMPHPWFLPTPAPDGTWGDGKMDDDIHFWRQFAKAGGRVFLAPHVTIGHLSEDIRWPGDQFNLVHQSMIEYNASGKPAGVFGSVSRPADTQPPAAKASP